jgi:hypothetical protein
MPINKQLPLVIEDQREPPTFPLKTLSEILNAIAEVMLQVMHSDTDEEGDDERHR